MRNACILIGKNINLGFDKSVSTLTDCFSQHGYFLEEIRFLSFRSAEKFREDLQSLKRDFDNLLLITEKSGLGAVKRYMLPAFEDKHVKNSYGEAAIYEDNGKVALLLSADDSETGLTYLKNVGIPFLQNKYGRLEKSVIRTMGMPEYLADDLMTEVGRLCKGKMQVNRFRKYDEEVVEIVYDNNTPKMLADDVLRRLMDGFGDTVYALEATSLEEQLVALLKLRGKKLSVAESFTGGGLARRIVSVPGASEVYFEGLNTYNEASKMKRLGVAEFTLRSRTAVSDQTAYEMALGLLNTGDCDISISTTGLAGPKSDRLGQPVGLCYIAVGTKERITVYRYTLDGSRTEITEKAINYALFLACKRLKNL